MNRTTVARHVLAVALAYCGAPTIASAQVTTCPAQQTARGTFIRLQIPGATEIIPEAINDRGDIVGSYRNAQGSVDGFLLRSGSLTIIHVPNSITTNANDINNKGDITGVFDGHAFVLHAGTYTMIDVPGAFESTAHAINDRRVVAGEALEPNDSDGRQVGFVRDRDGTFERIAPTDDSALVADINDHGTLLVNSGQNQFLRIDGDDVQLAPCQPSEVVIRITNHLGLIGQTPLASAPSTFVGFARSAKRTEIYRYPGSDTTTLRDRNRAGVAVGEANVPDVGQVGFVFVPRAKGE